MARSPMPARCVECSAALTLASGNVLVRTPTRMASTTRVPSGRRDDQAAMLGSFPSQWIPTNSRNYDPERPIIHQLNSIDANTWRHGPTDGLATGTAQQLGLRPLTPALARASIYCD